MFGCIITLTGQDIDIKSSGFTLTYMQLFMSLPWTVLTYDMEYVHAC